jgi:hypothetical protein
LLSKDVIKETLFDRLGIGDVEWSKRLGAASVEVLFALTEDAPGAVLDGFWDREPAAPAASDIPGISTMNASATSTTGSQRAGASGSRSAAHSCVSTRPHQSMQPSSPTGSANSPRRAGNR